MSPELLAKKAEAIDDKAEREKASVKYIIDLIEANEAELRMIFLSDEELAGDEYTVSELLFTRVTESLQSLGHDYIAAFGVHVYEFSTDQPIVPAPEYLAGWTDVKVYAAVNEGTERLSEGTGRYLMHMNEHGIAVIDGLRTVQGLSSLQEERSERRRRHEASLPGFSRLDG